MSRWPSWRFEKEQDKLESEASGKKVDEAKAEAVEALTESYNQLEAVRELSQKHQPVRKEMRLARQRNNFAEGLLRIIKEGR